MSDEERLKELAAECAEFADHWHGKFIQLGWLNVAFIGVFGPIGALCLAGPTNMMKVCGVFLLALSFLMLVNAARCFHDARVSWNNFMQLRDTTLKGSDKYRTDL